MDFSAPHAGFVIAAYGLSAILLVGLTLSVILRERALRREASQLERHRGSAAK
jgi:heme exporter protein CcmD